MTLFSKDSSYPAAIPFRITLADGRTRTDPTTFAPEEIAGAGYVVAPEQPTFDPATHRLDWDGSEWQVVELPPPLPPTGADVIAERERRLAFGLTFDFGDARGVHIIGTAPEDMKRWVEEVTPFANALVNSGNPDGTINLLTVTGPVTVTAQEWQSILVAAGEQRQPIYAASFALQAMNTIPRDFADNQYWP